MAQYVTAQNELVDRVAHAYDLTTAQLYDSNPHLASLPLVLPMGTVIDIPDVPLIEGISSAPPLGRQWPD